MNPSTMNPSTMNPSPINPNPAKILIVDDQADLRKLIRLTLQPANFQVSEAITGQEALERAAEIVPDLVLLDVMMPGDLNGYGVCRALKARPQFARTKVILLTARGQEADLELGRVAGADDYLVKPFSPTQLLNLVHTLTQPVRNIDGPVLK
jgi:two-component system, OmpR family, phosphate regulon response regulator PhoB